MAEGEGDLVGGKERGHGEMRGLLKRLWSPMASQTGRRETLGPIIAEGSIVGTTAGFTNPGRVASTKRMAPKSCILLSLMLLAGLLPLGAESRTWTDKESKRTIEGTLVEKSMANDRIRIERTSGSSVWVDISRLIDADRTYAQNWEKAENLISTRLVKRGKGWREVGVLAVGGTHGGRVVMLRYPRDPRPVVHELKPGQKGDYLFKGNEDWIVRFWSGDKKLDEESALEKTGIRDRR